VSFDFRVVPHSLYTGAFKGFIGDYPTLACPGPRSQAASPRAPEQATPGEGTGESGGGEGAHNGALVFPAGHRVDGGTGGGGLRGPMSKAVGEARGD
jgi:hypothetical protein